MRDAANAALVFVTGRTRGDLDTDQMLQFALVRALEVIGEAADKLSVSAHTAYPSVPWGEIIGIRHRLISFMVTSTSIWTSSGTSRR